jgi:hypothetical protein
VPTLAFHRINGDSARKYHLMDEEFPGGIVIPLGTYYLRDEEPSGGTGFRRELLAHRQGILSRKGIPREITSSFTLIITGKIIMREKSSER